MQEMPSFGYSREELTRENRPFYIGLSDSDIGTMLEELGLQSLEDLYGHIPSAVKMEHLSAVPEAMDYFELARHLFDLSQKNKRPGSFLGDGLSAIRPMPIVSEICKIRELGTAYTPYQPERSQGTLMTLWIYQSVIAALSGFEAINASLWDRSTCLFEAIQCAIRQVRGSHKAILAGNLHPHDLEVLQTMVQATGVELITIPYSPQTGLLNLDEVRKTLESTDNAACLCFPQVSAASPLENVDALTDLAHEFGLKAVAVLDPILLGQGGLKRPVDYGQNGADIFVGEGQHLAIGPNYGGPGLGIFGIRFHEKEKNAVRNTAGRYVGDAKDLNGTNCKVMVLSTREQHIRKEKATSNICSNQSFIATLAGASILERGNAGIQKLLKTARERALILFEALGSLSGVEPAFPEAPFFQEFALLIPEPVPALIQDALEENLLPGIDITPRLGRNALLVSVTDWQSEEEIQALIAFFEKRYGKAEKAVKAPVLPEAMGQQEEILLPETGFEEILAWYKKLGELNLSPDQGLYPLGSCTMKYNPYINEWAASLPGFTDIHPQAPETSVQGAMEVLYQTQELFKAITGLPAVTTQPVAGAQGELVGIKLFQAYHRDHSQTERDIILLPKSAHGTNFATATVAGYKTRGKGEKATGIQLIEASDDGRINMSHFRELMETYAGRVAGVMITNPNTCGILETEFAEIAQAIHQDGGLVYMDGANMNAIAGWLDLGRLGVDAVHQNLHKTWSIPHGGGGPGDCVVAVSEKLAEYLPGLQVISTPKGFEYRRPVKSIGSVHRHFGNFAHKVRCYTYLRALGREGIRKMSACATLSARWLHQRLSRTWPTLPSQGEEPRMHEFILTLPKETFTRCEQAGIQMTQVIGRVGKLFLDFGLHAPTVAWPETYGLMVEPTESFTLKELRHFADVVDAIRELLDTHPEVLLTAPHFTPIQRVDDVEANKNLVLSEKLLNLPTFAENKVRPELLMKMPVEEVQQKIIEEHKRRMSS